jgi:DNA-directed RNA polymerase specialized sigma54-like protein
MGQDAIEAREHFYNSIVSPLTLQEHLTEQIRESGLSAEHQGDAKIIVGDLTDHGYLDSSLQILQSTFKFRSNALRMLLPLSKILTPQELVLLTYANAFFSSLIT